MPSDSWSMRPNNKPQRRVPNRKYKDYTHYKEWIREDFYYRCGYCSIHENTHGGYWHFHVDHYKPKSRPEFKCLKTEYSNLLYSCDHCNVLKSDTWVSGDPLLDGVGWLDPCEHDLNEHYCYGYENGEFTLIRKTKVGKWMSSQLLLDQPARIRRYHNIAENEIIENEIIQKLEVLLEKAKKDDDLNDIATYTDLLYKLKEKVAKRYVPEPFEKLHRRT